MLVSQILRDKGRDVATLPPDATVRDLLSVLAERRIGAVVVSGDGSRVDGIVSERDVVRAMAAHDGDVRDEPLSAIMTSEVHTCVPGDHVDDLMRLMTEQRVRHLPVVVDDALSGLISIGDVVKSRMVELELERDSLAGYISTAG